MSRVEGLIRDYDGFKVDIPEWEIADSGVTALWGPSGSGKTSVFRLLLGVEPCPTLRWWFGNEDLALMSPPDRRIGVVFQSLELFPHMTAEENILFAARARSMPMEDARNTMNDLAEVLRLTAILTRKAAVLSGGEAQRVALARAVIAHPRFLFLDEPFSSLDSELRDEARTLVRKLIEKLKIPTLLVTHDQKDLEALAQHIVRIKNGKLL